MPFLDGCSIECGIDHIHQPIGVEAFHIGRIVGANRRAGAAALAHDRIHDDAFAVRIQHAGAVGTGLDAAFAKRAEAFMDAVREALALEESS